MCSHSEQTGRHPKHVRWHQSTKKRGGGEERESEMKARRRNRQQHSDEKRVLPCLLAWLLSVNKADFFSLRQRYSTYLQRPDLMYYLSSTWIISNELKLMSWKPFRTFYCVSGNAKFLPRARVIRTCFLAQQGWLRARTLRASQTHLSPKPRGVVSVWANSGSGFSWLSKNWQQFWSRLLCPLQIGCLLCPSPSNPLYILFTSGYVCSAEVAVKPASSGVSADEAVWGELSAA